MPVPPLPSARAFVTELLNSLPPSQTHDASIEPDPSSDAPENGKKQLLTLQVLFPNELLPALDLLDRNLVTRFLIDTEEPTPITDDIELDHYDATTSAMDVQLQNSEPRDTAISANVTVPRFLRASDTVYYVRSAQQRPSRFSISYDTSTSYEVRPNAWNCTCPAFAFAAFSPVYPKPVVPMFGDPDAAKGMQGQQPDQLGEMRKPEITEWIFGGSSLGQNMPPVCKHLLACVLAERCGGVLGQCVNERRVSVETAAGWAAGWGDA